MRKRLYVIIPVLILVSSSIGFWGCSKKNVHDLEARPSSEWVTNAIIYEINLRSFSQDGALKTVQKQIPELKKLGISVISLMPIHPIGELNRKGTLGSVNAAKDFYAVNPEFGTREDLQSLVSTCHQHGLKIIINLVINQAAWDSPLLMEHPDWFVQNEEGAIVSPNIESSDVAQIDYRQHEPRKYMIAMMKFWVREIGIDGFQCRAAELIPTDFWTIARKELDRIKPVMMISESRLPEHHLDAFDLTGSWNINTACEDIISGTVPASIINDSLNEESIHFPKGSLHIRSITECDEDIHDGSDDEKSNLMGAGIISVLAFTLPGVPLIYSGDESRNNIQIELFSKMYQDVSALRRNHTAFQDGSYVHVQNSVNAHLFSFIRFSGRDSVLIVINFSNNKLDADVQMPAGASLMWKDQFTGADVLSGNSRLPVAVPPLSFLAFMPSSEKVMR